VGLGLTFAAVNPSTHLFWITSRAAGVCALVLSSVSVMVGVLQGGRLFALPRRGPELRALHEALSLATLAALAVHGLSLLGDSWLHPGIAGIGIPFAGSYRSAWTGIGIISGYGLGLLGLSYYWRARIGVERWRTLHRLTALFWAGGVVHSLGAGTDGGTWWFVAMTAVVAAPAAVLVMARFVPRNRGTPQAASAFLSEEARNASAEISVRAS
jgi:sulfoxide reductase heme-binding subunit YedZ